MGRSLSQNLKRLGTIPPKTAPEVQLLTAMGRRPVFLTYVSHTWADPEQVTNKPGGSRVVLPCPQPPPCNNRLSNVLWIRPSQELLLGLRQELPDNANNAKCKAIIAALEDLKVLNHNGSASLAISLLDAPLVALSRNCVPSSDASSNLTDDVPPATEQEKHLPEEAIMCVWIDCACLPQVMIFPQLAQGGSLTRHMRLCASLKYITWRSA